VLGKPARRFCFRDDREDLDRFARDVMDTLNSPARRRYCGWLSPRRRLIRLLLTRVGLVPKVPFKGVPHFGPAVGGQKPAGLGRLGGQDDLAPHSGQNIARIHAVGKYYRCGLRPPGGA
jgi:hypothetical protein